MTVHDLTFLLLRRRYRGRLNARYASAATRSSVRRAGRVLCGSVATRESLVAHLGVNGEKITVIPYGVSDTFFATPRLNVGLGSEPGVEPYVLFVGTREARKGLSTLYAALRLVNAERQRVRLVLAGQDGWGTERLMQEMRRDPAVELRDKPSDQDLAHLYRGALVLAYPSEMEGFGLPVAEAMACGCPVIASNLPSIHEFAEEHPVYIAVGDSGGLARQIERFLNGDADVEPRRTAGHDAVTSLRWSVLGDRTALVLEQVFRERAARR